MCGIGGFVDFDRDARRGGPVLSAMDRRLRPRGPDASGTYTDPDAALVHRRLIVIDPEGGAQPMLSPDGNTVLVYNGELYNTDEVRDSLTALGHVFRSRSDTEVVLHAFLEWDTDAFARLDGMHGKRFPFIYCSEMSFDVSDFLFLRQIHCIFHVPRNSPRDVFIFHRGDFDAGSKRILYAPCSGARRTRRGSCRPQPHGRLRHRQGRPHHR